jgi:uncharacterized DUF497 family protein
MDEINFDWDPWNLQKNEEKHGVSSLEAESIFHDPNLKIFEDQVHTTAKEKRWIAYGQSIHHRIMMAAFTVRSGKARIISARVASKKERKVYEEA